MKHELPPSAPGLRIGLLGGSFDPPHIGHVHITQQALHRFGLDRVWWLVSPGNPLKAHQPAPLPERMAAAREIMDHPRVTITDLEAGFGTRLTIDLMHALLPRYPDTRFTWLMGGDNLASFHLWEGWREIAQMVRIGVLARPGTRLSARLSPAARALAHWRLPQRRARLLGAHPAPCWAMVDMPMRSVSSSAIRAGRMTPEGASRPD